MFKPIVLAFILAIGFYANQSFAAENVCGWIEANDGSKPTLMITDSRETWVIVDKRTMDYAADGLQSLPKIAVGKSCGCIKADVDHHNRIITEVYGGKNLPLKQCLADKKLLN